MTVPEKLKRQQFWFGGVIAQPLDDDSIQPLAPSGNTIEAEAALHIAPSPTLKPWQRMEIYNQQYWWRLLKTLQNLFPTLTRLFGYQDFNKSIAVPYLLKYPSNHWSVDRIGDRLPDWVLEEYHAEDRQLVYDAAAMDLAIDSAFTIETKPPISGERDLLDCKIALQPWIRLFKWRYDLLSFHEKLMEEEADYYAEHDFPKLPQDEEKYIYVIYRDAENQVVWDRLSDAEYQVLKCLEDGKTISETCDWLEQQKDLRQEAAAHLLHWFQEWTLKKWLVQS